jgi:hypothetical protein
MRGARAWSRRLGTKLSWLLGVLRAALDWQDPRLPPLGMA